MNTTARLTFAFSTVILIMVLGGLGYTLVTNTQEGKTLAAAKVNQAVRRLQADFTQIQAGNRELATHLAHDKNLLDGLANQDRGVVATAIKTACSERNFVGFVTVVDEHGKVFFSSDTPAKFGYSAREKSSGVDYVFRSGTNYIGPAAFTATGTMTISSMIPLTAGSGKLSGVVIASEPLNSEFLIGEVTKLAILPEPLPGIDLALLNGHTGSLTQATSGLLAENCPFVHDLQTEGIKALPGSPFDQISNFFGGFGKSNWTFVKSNRWWQRLNLTGVQSRANAAPELVGVLLVCSAIPEAANKFSSNLFLYGTVGALAALAALILSAWLVRSINAPLPVLMKRMTELASQKPDVSSVVDLSSDWLPLSKKIDETVLSLRATIQNLKSQLAKLTRESDEKTQQTKHTDSQFDSLNNRMSTQSRQVSELSRQINHANRQSVLLQQKLDAVLQSSAEGFLSLDQFGNVLSANAVFLYWLGVSESEIVGQHCFDLVKKPGEPNESKTASREAFTKHGGEPHSLINEFYPEGIIYNKQTEKAINVLAHLQPISGQNSTIQGYVMVLRDKSLRSEIAQLRSEIIAMLSDSIRSPLTKAESAWEALLLSTPKVVQPAVGQSLAELHEQYKNLLSVIDNLLMIHGGASSSATATRESFAVSRLAAECMEAVGEAARARKLSLDYKGVAGLPNLNSNRNAVRDILVQLLTRMISVTADSGKVRVELTVKGSNIRFSISSSGPALPESETADMFAGFIQDKHEEESYSWRLSMYATRNNVERLGGKIWAESDPERGTNIYFTLPLG